MDSGKLNEPSISDQRLDKITITRYSIEERKSIRTKIEKLIGFSLTDNQFNSILEIWLFRNLLIALCNKSDFKSLRLRVDKFIDRLEFSEREQPLILEEVNILYPIFNQAEIEPIQTVNTFELNRLKEVRKVLSRKKGMRGNEAYITKCAFFELFFIGEALGLKSPTESGYVKNDLITFAEIVAKPINPKREHISDHHQKYANFKEQHPVIIKCIEAAKSVIDDEALWLMLQEGFQTCVYSNIPIPSSK